MLGHLDEELAGLAEFIRQSPLGEIARGHDHLGNEVVVLFQSVEIIGQSLEERIKRSIRVKGTESPEPMVPAELHVGDMQAG